MGGAWLLNPQLTPTLRGARGLHSFRSRMSLGFWLPFTQRCTHPTEEDGTRTYISGSQFTRRTAGF